MNTLGREIVTRLHARGEQVLALDTDPQKLEGLPCETMLGDVEYFSVLEEAELPHARLLVSALRIEPTNDLLAYRCKQAGVPCSIQVVDLSVTDNLLEMDVKYLMIPKVDGIKLQNRELKERGLLSP
jgi:Trk K+ transport system NAD-binding subunit